MIKVLPWRGSGDERPYHYWRRKEGAEGCYAEYRGGAPSFAEKKSVLINEPWMRNE